MRNPVMTIIKLANPSQGFEFNDQWQQLKQVLELLQQDTPHEFENIGNHENLLGALAYVGYVDDADNFGHLTPCGKYRIKLSDTGKVFAHNVTSGMYG